MLCARSAEQIVHLIQCLERNRLLVQISPDVIHMLSQAALVSDRMCIVSPISRHADFLIALL